MNKIAIVTGGSSGIGLAITKRLLSEHYRVFNLDISPADIGDYIYCDVSKVIEVELAINSVIEDAGRIDVLVSNAGIHLSANIEQTSEAELDMIFSLNVKGAYAAIKSSLSQMKKQASGVIILISSDQALVGKPNSFAYNLSKAALASIAKTTALDYATYNIRVNAVCPGTIDTPLYHRAINNYCDKSGADKTTVHKEEAALQPLGRIGQPEEVANLVAFLVSEQAQFITGSLQLIDGGYTAR